MLPSCSPDGHADPAQEAPDAPLSLWRELGISEAYYPDEQAPPVDERVVARLVRRELDPDAAAVACEMISVFRPWREAYSKALSERLPPADGSSTS